MAAAATAVAAAAAAAGHTEKHQNTFNSCWPKSNRVLAGEGPMALADTALLHASVASWKWGTPIVIWPERWSPWGWRVQGSRGLELNQCEFPGAYHRCYQRLGHLFDSYTSTRSKRCPSKSASSATPIGWAGIAEGVARNIDKLDEGIARVTGVASLPRQTWKMRWPLPDSRLRGTQPLAGNRGVTPGAK